MKLSKTILAVLGLVVAVGIQGCLSSNERADFQRLPEYGWCYGDTIKFNDFIAASDSSAAPASSAAPSDLYFALRHTNDYPYRNLWVEINYVDQSGSVRRDSVSLELCDIYGRWYGKGMGDLYQVQTLVVPAARIAPGSDVSVRHIMRVDTLRGIESVGLLYGR